MPFLQDCDESNFSSSLSSEICKVAKYFENMDGYWCIFKAWSIWTYSDECKKTFVFCGSSIFAHTHARGYLFLTTELSNQDNESSQR